MIVLVCGVPRLTGKPSPSGGLCSPFTDALIPVNVAIRSASRAPAASFSPGEWIRGGAPFDATTRLPEPSPAEQAIRTTADAGPVHLIFHSTGSSSNHDH